MERKRFLRFIVADDGDGKIKAVSGVIKLYDDDGNFVRIDGNHIYALDGQIEVDVEGAEYKDYRPLRHYKHESGTIVKKSDSEIAKSDNDYAKAKADRQEEINDNKVAIEDQKTILFDSRKSTEQRLNAIEQLIRLGAIKING